MLNRELEEHARHCFAKALMFNGEHSDGLVALANTGDIGEMVEIYNLWTQRDAGWVMEIIIGTFTGGNRNDDANMLLSAMMASKAPGEMLPKPIW